MRFSDQMARFNRLPNRLVQAFAGRRLSPMGVVEHRGRRSGRTYRTPGGGFRLRGGFGVSLPDGPARDWVRTVLAAGSCTLERRGRRVELTRPTVLRGGEGRALLPAP